MAKPKQTDSQNREILGILLMALGVLVLIGLISYHPGDYPNSGSSDHVRNWLGLAGAFLSHFLYVYTIGYPCLIFPFLIFLLGWNLFLQKGFRPYFRISAYILALGLFLSTALALREAVSEETSQYGYRLSGLLGGFFAEQLARYLGAVGSVVVLLTFLLLFLVSATSWSMREAVLGFRDELAGLLAGLRKRRPRSRAGAKPVTPSPPAAQRPPIQILRPDTQPAPVKDLRPPVSAARPPAPPRQAETRPGASTHEASSGTVSRHETPAEQGTYVFPPLELLNPPLGDAWSGDPGQLESKARFLEEKLSEFGVQGTVTGVQPGPVITRFEISPAPGVKVSRFVGVQDDLALVMRASRVRVVAPIPGKAAVGIEIPNDDPATVSIREILNSETFRDSTSKLAIALGKTTDGKPYVTDLARLPHLLVAGATGSGKSVCLNTIIASILYRAKPHEVKLVLIDPKKLELSLYKKLKHHHLTTGEHLGEDVITTVDNAVAVLRSAEREMERRYRILARVGVRNIDDFNTALETHHMKPPEEEGFALEHLPYVILVVDELADLMMTGAREVEEPIARLAQMSRAVGIHLILATQRPSVDVITGVIKANFPARIAFQVTAKTDSRTILDRNGAEKLLGRGDMLFLHPREAEPIRVHGAYMGTDEVQRVVQHIHKQPHEAPWLLPGVRSGGGGSREIEDGERDDLLWEAAKLVVRHQQGSASLLQRRLRVGYARAGRLIDELEDRGIVGPFDGSKAREVLVDEEGLELIRQQEEGEGD
ncbi:MAG TPA: DNA translocase FtsK [bacterium]|nr:DNA translocase FtsK [bacterium]